MFPVSPIDGNAYYGAKPVPKKDDLDMKTFMRLLTVQLVNQNPTEPMNDRDFFAQMAQLGQVQGLDKVQASVDMTQAASLIGKTVTVVRPFSETGLEFDSIASGKVERITIKNGERLLGVREPNGGIIEVSMNAIREVSE